MAAFAVLVAAQAIAPAILATAASAATSPTAQPCTNVVTGSPYSVAASGGTWCITNANVGTTVSVAAGTNVIITNSNIGSTISASGGGFFALCGSTVGSAVTVSGATGFIVIGDRRDDNCGGNTLRSTLTLTNNRGGLEVMFNARIAGAVTIRGNTGAGPFPDDNRPKLGGNAIGGTVACTSNSPTVWNGGAANTVGGTASDECADIRTGITNSPPVANADSNAVNEDGVLTFAASSLTANDSPGPAADAGQTLTVTGVSATASTHGIVGLVGGTVNYTPDHNFNGAASFSYTVTDDGSTNASPDPKSANGTVNVTVNPVPDPPTDVGLTPSAVFENSSIGTVVGTLSTTDPDLPGDSHAYTLVSGTGSTDNGSFQIPVGTNTLKTNGVFDFEVKSSYSIRVRTTDSTGNFFEKALTVSITNVNEAPTAVADTYFVPAGGLTVAQPGVLGNDTDPDGGDTRTAVLVTGPAHAGGAGGSFALNANGSFNYKPETAFTTGTDSFTYKARDAGNLDSNTVTVSLPLNQPPVADNDGPYTLNEDSSISVPAASGVLQGDVDPDTSPNPTLTAVLGTGPAHAASFTLNADGSFSYTPVADYAGADSFTYKANDGGSDSNVATVSITVTPVNDAPVLADRSPTLTAENEDAPAPVGSVGTPVSALVDFATPTGQVDNVSDPDGGALLGIAVTAADATNGTWWFSTNNGTNWTALGAPTAAAARLLAADANTRLYFQPSANFNGTVSSAITFRAWDQTTGTSGSTADTTSNGGTTAYSSATDTAALTVNAVNDAPVLADGSPTLAAENEDAPAPVGSVGTPVSALVDFASPPGQVDNVTDVDVSPQLGIAVTAADTTNGSWFFSTNNGTSWTALGAVTGSSARLLAADANTRLYFQPNANFNGSISSAITFRAWDVTSGTNGGAADTSTNGGTTAYSSATDSAALTVNAVNDAPALDASKTPVLTTVLEEAPAPAGAVGTPVSGLVDFATPSGQVDNVTDVDASPQLGIAITAADATKGAWFYSIDNGANWNALGIPTASSALLLRADTNSRLYFQPNANANGSPAGTITFRAWDQTTGTAGNLASTTINGGTTAFSTATNSAAINVTAVNDAPSFTKGADQSVSQNTGAHTVAGWAAAISAGAADESGQILTFHVTATTNSTLFSVQPAVDPSTGDLTFTVAPGVVASPVTANVSIYLTDNGGSANSGSDTSPTQTFTITVVPNTSPVAGNDGPYTTAEDTPLSVPAGTGVLANDSDADIGDTITAQPVTVPAHALSFALNADGSFSYTPAADYNGPDSFTYVAVDNHGATSNTATVSLNVTAVNDAPRLTNIEATTLSYNEQDSETTITSTLQVADPDDANLAGATVSITAGFQNGADVLAFTPLGNITGSYNSATGVLTLSGSDTVANYQTALRSATFRNTSDTPTTSRTISFTATDPHAATSSAATRNISITAVNDPPTNTVPGAQSVNEDTNLPFTGPNTISVADPDAGAGSIKVDVSVAHGTLTLSTTTGLTFDAIKANGTATVEFTGTLTNVNNGLATAVYKGTQDYNGPDTLTVLINDQGNTGTGGALTDSDTVGITVN
ncbi:MAG: Ig family protein, partial [Acidimicrobiales bacterium]|nr:Ig family protein [Acidimicrobiales bacterium]